MRQNPDRQPDEDRETALVEAARTGDREAFGALVRRYQRMVTGVAWRYGVDRNEVEDVVSEVFIKLYGSLDRYRPSARFGSWLYRLAVNHVIDHGRRTRHERHRVEMPAQPAVSGPAAPDTLEAAQRDRILRDCLAELPARYREALLLVYVEGMKVDQAAATLAIPAGTVKTRLLRGRQALGKLLVRKSPELFGGSREL